MFKSFFHSIPLILAVILLTVSLANAQNFTDGDIIHMRDANDALTEANLVEFGQTLNLPMLDLYFQVTIKDNISTDTVISVATSVPTDQTEPTPTFHYKDDNQWLDLTTSTGNGGEQIQYSTLKNIATTQNATSVEVGIKFTTIPGSRFQVHLGHGTAASDAIDRVYFDCHPGTHSPAVYDVTDDGLINNADITAVSQAIIDNSLTGDVSEDDRVNTVDFDLVTFAVAQGMVITNRAPTAVGSIPDKSLRLPNLWATDISTYFSDPDGDTLTYTAVSADTSKATVAVAGGTLNATSKAVGSTEITVTASDGSLSLSRSFTLTILPSGNQAPTPVGTIPAQNLNSGETVSVDVSSYFSDPDGDAMTYGASSSDTTKATVSITGTASVVIAGVAAGTATITVTAIDISNATGTQAIAVTVVDNTPSQADTIPGLSTEEQLLLGELLTFDTVIFNELYNGSDDTNDYLELRNVSAADLSLDAWQLSILTRSGNVVIPFPAGTVIPAGEVLLLVNTENSTADTWEGFSTPTFALPQEEFALILRGPSMIGDLAGNYLEDGTAPLETMPILTVDTVWHRNQPIVSGYLAEAWSSSTQATLAEAADLNNDGVVNILDLVLVASQFGTDVTPAADLNNDGSVNIQDLVLVANALNRVR